MSIFKTTGKVHFEGILRLHSAEFCQKLMTSLVHFGLVLQCPSSRIADLLPSPVPEKQVWKLENFILIFCNESFFGLLPFPFSLTKHFPNKNKNKITLASLSDLKMKGCILCCLALAFNHQS